MLHISILFSCSVFPSCFALLSAVLLIMLSNYCPLGAIGLSCITKRFLLSLDVTQGPELLISMSVYVTNQSVSHFFYLAVYSKRFLDFRVCQLKASFEHDIIKASLNILPVLP